MNRNIILTTILGLMLMASAALAQSTAQSAGKTLGTVVNGNTTTDFQAAHVSDLDINRLKAWSNFAAANPPVARELGHSPSLISNDNFVNKHADLAKLFSENPGLRDAMIADPANYVVPTSKPAE
jgi:hypothetical protein